MTSSISTLIHIGKRAVAGGQQTLLLRHVAERHFEWYVLEDDGRETATEVRADTIEEALRQAHRCWKSLYFRTLGCGFRYTLPERDEHGINALFYQMAASLNTLNGIYFDSELGHNCFVQNASLEAIQLWRTLRDAGKL